MTSVVTHDRVHGSQFSDSVPEATTNKSSAPEHLNQTGRNSLQLLSGADPQIDCLHANSEDNISLVDNSYFQDGNQSARNRRNAIDFSPVDVGAGEEEINNNSELEYELKVHYNNTSDPVVSSDCDFVTDSEMMDNHEVVSEPVITDKIDTSSNESLDFENDSDDDEDIFDSIGVASSQFQEKEQQIGQNLFLWGGEDMECSGESQNSTGYKTYGAFCEVSHRLSNLPLVPSHSTESSPTESLSHPNATPCIRPVTAKRLLPQLECCYAYMHGGKDFNDAPIICLPHYPDLREVTEEDFRDVILYITSVTRACDADVGFVLVIDRRRDKWPSLRGALVRLAGFFPGCLRMVLVLRPVGFLQGKLSNIGFRWRRDEFAMKMTMLSGLDELYSYISPSQLTQEFGGSFDYDHKTWIRNRMLIEDFTSHATEVGMSLELYGSELAETEFPNNISSTQILIKVQEENTNNHKEKIDNLLKAAVTLKSTIQTPLGGSIIANPENTFESDTLQSIMALIEETDTAFEQFWLKHEEKLKQCLELRQFEQDYRVVISKLSTFQQWFDSQNSNKGTSIPWVESLIGETDRMHDTFVKCKEECILLSERGGVLIEEQHYAVDCIAPKCSEVIKVSASINQLFQRKTRFLSDAKSILTAIDELNSWCERAMSILASQAIEKPHAFDGAKQALLELEAFFEHEEEKAAIPEDPVPPGFKTFVQNANLRHKEVKSIYEKQRAALKKVIAKHMERPVQVVEPSKKVPPSTEGIVLCNNENKERPKSASLSSSPKRSSSPVTYSSQNSEPFVKLQHVMKELLATEKVYVDELKSIVEGYGEAIDDVKYADVVPEELKGKRRVLLGNMEDIYSFHATNFLSELEECKDTPSLVGKCFIKRKDEFNIYSEYCQNSAKSERLRAHVGEQHQFFLDCQQRLGHRLSLAAYLLKPVQRITKYQLLLQQILKYSSQHVKELQSAVQAMLAVLKAVNDSMHQTAIRGFPTDLDSLGKLFMQGRFSMQIDHKKTKVKNLARPRFSKTVQRHLFLYERELLFCKEQSNETNSSDSNSGGISQSTSSLGGCKGHHYQFKNSIKMNAVGITETLKGDPRKFEIWYQGREDVYTLLASSVLVKQDWVREIKKVLSSQPKSETTPPEPHTGSSRKVAKAKRSESFTKKARPGVVAVRDTPKPDKSTDTKKKSTLIRSASMGKGKDKVLRRKLIDDSSAKIALGKIADDDEKGKGDVFNSKRKSRSLPRLAEPPRSLSDAEDASDYSTPASSKFVVMKERTDILDDGEVVLHVGDDVDILEKGKEGWVKVRIQQTGQEGWAPTNHIVSSFERTPPVLAN